MQPMKIAMLTHSTNARGGVVHALNVAEQLQALGQQVTLFAPDPKGRGLFRAPRCGFHPVPGGPVSGDIAAMVQQRIDDYLRCFDSGALAGFDLWHAQDSISANALATLAARGAIAGYVRTVHHLDQFADARLHAWQERGYRQAAQLLCVSQLWQTTLQREHGLQAELVANGVDLSRFTAVTAVDDTRRQASLGLGGAPVVLAVGGVEPRKNSIAILQAFMLLRRDFPNAQLVIAGGASVLDHQDYQRRFHAELAASALPPCAVHILGQVADDDMPALFRGADVLAFPSTKEGFGLVVLEAMASGVPVVVSQQAPFTEYLDQQCCLWVDPADTASIALGMARALLPATRARLAEAAQAVCHRFSWRASSLRHLDIYRRHLRLTAPQIKEESHA